MIDAKEVGFYLRDTATSFTLVGPFESHIIAFVNETVEMHMQFNADHEYMKILYFDGENWLHEKPHVAIHNYE